MNRRNLIKSGFYCALSSGILGCKAKSQYGDNQKIKYIEEIFDVIVCGGGPAGIASAISAARNGAKTCLIEYQGCLGGIWTSGLLGNILDYKGKDGIMKEIMEQLEKSDAQIYAQIYDPEYLKLLVEELCIDAGVHIRLHTRVVGAEVENKRIKSIDTESCTGRERWFAKCFIDATGNGDLAAYAGCNYDLGHPVSGKTQPMSLMGIVCGINRKDLEGVFISGYGSNPKNKENLRLEIEKSGFTPSYAIPTLFAFRHDIMVLMANHEYDVSVTDAQQLTDATINARKEVHKIVNGLRSIGGIWKDIRLVTTGGQIGIREGRRIKGYYTLTKDDMIKGSEFDDAVCKATYIVDIHSLDYDQQGYSTDGIVVKPYDIPLRSLIAKDVDGLMMVGRCISGDFYAHASYRVSGNAVSTGEAAGLISATAAKENKCPHEIKWN